MNNMKEEKEIEQFLKRSDDQLMSKGDIRKRKRQEYNRGNHLFKFYTVRDFVYIAVMSAAMLVSCFTMPLMNAIPVFGMGFVGIAFQVCFFQAVIASKIKKQGTIFFSAIILGVFHLAMAPQMFLFCLASGILCEILAMILGGYKTKIGIILPSSFFSLFILGFYVGWDFLILGEKAFTKLYIENWWIPVLVAFSILILSILGSVSGTFLMAKLKKKGVLHD